MKLSIQKLRYYLFFIVSILFLACNNDNGPDIDIIQTDDDDIPRGNNIVFPDKEGLEVLAGEKVYDGYILVNDASANRVYLMDKTTSVIHDWNLDGKRLGNDAFLQNDGTLLAMLESESPIITLGGFGGLLSIINKDGGVEWSYEYSNEEHIAHHDAQMLPSGNILFLSWEKNQSKMLMK